MYSVRTVPPYLLILPVRNCPGLTDSLNGGPLIARLCISPRRQFNSNSNRFNESTSRLPPRFRRYIIAVLLAHCEKDPASSIHGCGLNRNHLGRPTAVDRFQYLKRLKLSTFHFTIPFIFLFFKHLGCKCKCNDTDEVLLGTIQKRIRSENVPPVILFS